MYFERPDIFWEDAWDYEAERRYWEWWFERCGTGKLPGGKPYQHCTPPCKPTSCNPHVCIPYYCKPMK